MSEQTVAKRLAKYETVGVGCFIQGAGLLAPIILGFFAGIIGIIIGLVIGIILFLVGSAKSKKWICSNCKNPLADKDVKLCPACKAQLE